ncbi:MAG: cell division protein ZapA [Gemmatimonadales bacterium]
MSTQRHSVRVTLGGIELSLSSEHSPEYTREVAAYFDAVLARIRNSGPTLDAHRAALLAGLAVTDELFQARAGKGGGSGALGASDVARLRAMRDRLARLVAPVTKGATGRAKGA